MATFHVDPDFVEQLAATLRAGNWVRLALKSRVWFTFPDDRALTAKVVGQVWEHFGGSRPSLKQLTKFLKKAISALPHEPEQRAVPVEPAPMTARWPVPVLATPVQLAHWLNVPLTRLEWLADIKEWTLRQADAKLRHYVNVWVPRRRGKPRLLEAPKPHLKAIQRRILHEILDHIPPHDTAHGFRTGRSIVSYARPHVGKQMVLHFDLRDFFASVSAARVRAIFRTAGYPADVASLLTGLCTTRTPDDVTVAGIHWRRRHLPQGAPTSPAFANLAARRMDVRLSALAEKLGATYTRYADDLAISGGHDLERAVRRVNVLVGIIAGEEGFELNFRKTRFMRQSVCQQVAGVVVNVKTNCRREDFDRLKAILHNCARHGPACQNRERHPDFRRHLLGRVAHLRHLNPARGARLQALFEHIDWTR
ncbi:MAG: RNA-directed DNA polymerase [Planctomycetes bacterium]|nr:RNA-directed DNA polymerase [Planctomycetota bacterium]